MTTADIPSDDVLAEKAAYRRWAAAMWEDPRPLTRAEEIEHLTEAGFYSEPPDWSDPDPHLARDSIFTGPSKCQPRQLRDGDGDWDCAKPKARDLSWEAYENRPPCTADMDATAASDGFADAARVVARQHSQGMSLDVMAAYHDDLSTELASDAYTSYGRAYAAEYAQTARTLIADLRADVAAASTERPDPGTPHPARPGWIAHPSGVYVHEGGELATPQADREAC